MKQRVARKIGDNVIGLCVDYRPATMLKALRKVDDGIDAWWLRSFDLYADGRMSFFSCRVIRNVRKRMAKESRLTSHYQRASVV